MEGDANIRKARVKLRSYAGSNLMEGNITSRQKEAVEKMMYLEDKQFAELIMDVAREVDIRRNVVVQADDDVSESRKISRRKLRALSEVKFKNLVVDVILATDQKMPLPDDKQGMRALLDDLESLVTNLKASGSQEDRTLREIDSAFDFPSRFGIFIEYLKTKFFPGADVRVIDKMQALGKDYFNPTYEKTFVSILNAKTFMELSKKYFANFPNSEYNYHSRNIDYLIELRPGSYKQLIKKEMASIFAIMLNTNDVISSRDMGKVAGGELQRLTSAIENFVNIAKVNPDDSTIEGLCKEILLASKGFYEKLKSCDLDVDGAFIGAYERQQNEFEKIISRKPESYDLFNAVIEFTYFIKELFNILQIDP